MNENELIKVIKKSVGSEFIGDDCAYLKDLGIVITHDSLVENIHFKRDWCTPFQLGYKSVVVNISDVLASGAKPVYITIAISLPKGLNSSFVDEFYRGASSALNGAKIVGGDITGSDKDIMVSISAIGTTEGRNISSRKNAKIGYSIITQGSYGESSSGLNALIKGNYNNRFIKSHLEPVLSYTFSEQIAMNVKEPYAMMDTSDGLADALFKIAEASGVKIDIDYNKIPHDSEISKEQAIFGGEDYNLVAAIPSNYISKISNAIVIGNVVESDGFLLDISGEKYSDYTQLKVYNHFGA